MLQQMSAQDAMRLKMGESGLMQKKVSMRAEFLLKPHEDLKIFQGPVVTDEDLRKLIECIRKLMKEALEDFETN